VPHIAWKERADAFETENKALISKFAVEDVKPRRLTEGQKSSLTDLLANCGIRPKSISVIFSQSDREAAEFAHDIANAIDDAGIEGKAHNGFMYDHDPRDSGLKIIWGNSATTRTLADSLHEEFKSMNFSPERRKTKYKDSLAIVVARSPESD
jgi:hypothetical protein